MGVVKQGDRRSGWVRSQSVSELLATCAVALLVGLSSLLFVPLEGPRIPTVAGSPVTSFVTTDRLSRVRTDSLSQIQNVILESNSLRIWSNASPKGLRASGEVD